LNTPLGADSLDFPWKLHANLPSEIDSEQMSLDPGEHEDFSDEPSFSPRWVVVFGQDLDEREKTEREGR
jgi:hypothetical protein